MKFRKRLLSYLIFTTLLIISEAGGGRKPIINLQGSKPAISGTNTGSSNTGRENGANCGSAPAWGVPKPNITLVQPKPQTLGAPAWRSQTPGFRPQTPGVPSGVRPQNSGEPAWRPQNLGLSPQSPGLPSGVRPQNSVAPERPALGKPKLTYAEALLQRQQQMMDPSSSSTDSSGSGSQHSMSGSSSQLSLGSSSSGYETSGSINSQLSQNHAINIAKQISIASPDLCVDDLKTVPYKIALAEYCFDYFKLAITWSPGFAYEKRKNGINIRENKISPSWIIHGLWPAMYAKHQKPMPNCRRQDIYFRADRFVTNNKLTNNLKAKLDRSWYTLLAKGWSTNEKFWEHEFKDHGSCASRSRAIRDDVNYFAKTTDLFDALSLSYVLADVGYKSGRITKLGMIVDAIKQKVKKNVNVDFVINNLTGEYYLKEVFVCYDVSLNFIDCPRLPLPQYLLDTDITYVDTLQQ